MAAPGWGTSGSVARLLFSEGWRFEFYQAVRLLERMARTSREAVPVGEGTEPDREAVRFSSRVAFDFPASEVHEVELPKTPGEPARMTVNVLGLAGALGPLPAPFSELLLERLWAKDPAFRDFLDIFNHRLVSILHRAKKRVRPGLSWDRPDREGFSRAAFAFLGLGTEGVRGRMEVEDRALLQYTGLLARRARTAVGLEVMLADYFGVGVRCTQFVGRWMVLDFEQRTAIGRAGRNHELSALGSGAVLGSRAWDQGAGIELAVGPLALGQFLDFLPMGRAFRSLVQLVRFALGDGLAFDVRLTLKGADMPPCRLGCGPRLGWSAWLTTKPRSGDDSQVRLSGRTATGTLR
ncbi:MAG TPA: type VI secretion system baseplate subunit TssG [Thermoanaerobaculia bacterium]|nr:type VI secretion system baseplate subunit TssG [Thermoanaerobaculia bacterium]